MAVKADARFTGTGEVVSGAVRVFGVHIVSSGTAGRLVLKDGGSGGDTLVDIDTPSVAESDEVDFGGQGIYFATDVHCSTFSNVDGATLLYEDEP